MLFSGVIVNISATLQYKATPFQAHAAAAKAGIDVLTQVPVCVCVC
jgi:hypothetical protein